MTVDGLDVEPSKYHYPAWSLDPNRDLDEEDVDRTQRDYIVWGPGPIFHAGHPAMEYDRAINGFTDVQKVRDHWAAHWGSHGGYEGEMVSGDSLDEVLRIFPAGIAERFRAAVAVDMASGRYNP